MHFAQPGGSRSAERIAYSSRFEPFGIHFPQPGGSLSAATTACSSRCEPLGIHLPQPGGSQGIANISNSNRSALPGMHFAQLWWEPPCHRYCVSQRIWNGGAGMFGGTASGEQLCYKGWRRTFDSPVNFVFCFFFLQSVCYFLCPGGVSVIS